MCAHGTDVIVRVKVSADLSSTGEAKWREFGIDACIAPLVFALQAGGIDMRASCCGHGTGPGRIDLADGRVLLIAHSRAALHLTGDTTDRPASHPRGRADTVSGDAQLGAALRATIASLTPRDTLEIEPAPRHLVEVWIVTDHGEVSTQNDATYALEALLRASAEGAS